MGPFENNQPVEVKGQFRGAQMNPPGKGGGGTFQLLLENGGVIISPYPEKWRLEVGAAFHAKDVRRAVVSGIGEYSPDGKLQRMAEIESFSVAWADLESGVPASRRVAFRYMSDYFDDASYWLALIDQNDPYHNIAVEYFALLSLEDARVVTTQLALNEVLAPRSKTTPERRQNAINLVDRILRNPQVHIVPQSPEKFGEALQLLRAGTSDKEWSITDCASFLVMERFNIWEALTGDHHEIAALRSQ